jgi:oligopeptide transport system substrate-binding protein
LAYEGIAYAGQQATDRFRFRHNLFQRHIYDRIGAAERRLLHGDVGAALEALHGTEAEELAADLGRHFEQAGQGARAIPYLLRAGDQARLGYANDSAIGFYRRAIALLEHERDGEGLARALMRLALTYSADRDDDRSGHAYRQAFEAWGRAACERRGTGLTGQLLRFVMPHGCNSDLIVPFLYRGLVSSSQELEVLPDLAASWEIERNGTRYTFTIRDDARWSDGRPVTAEDFEVSWKNMLQPGSPNHPALLLYDIKGAKAYHTGVAADAENIGLRAQDPRTLVIDLERPVVCFLHTLTNDSLRPAPAPNYTIPAGPPERPEEWIVNGPYRVHEYHPGHVRFVRNSAYRGPTGGNVDVFEAFGYEDYARDQALGIDWYESDAIDMLDIMDYPSEIRHPAAVRHAEEVVVVHEPGTLGFAFDVTKPPFDDIRIRRAFCMAFDRERFNRVCREPVEPVTGGLIPPRIMGYTPGIELPYDPARARALLAEAGYPDGQGLPRLGWAGAKSTGSDETRHLFLKMYAENLGIGPDTYDVSEPPCDIWWRKMLESAEPIGSIFFYIIGYAYPDPDCYLRYGYELMVRNHGGWWSPEYDRLTRDARIEASPDDRARLYRRADAMLMEAAALVPFSYRSAVWLVKPWVKWMPMLPDGTPQFEHIIIEPH